MKQNTIFRAYVRSQSPGTVEQSKNTPQRDQKKRKRMAGNVVLDLTHGRSRSRRRRRRHGFEEEEKEGILLVHVRELTGNPVVGLAFAVVSYVDSFQCVPVRFVSTHTNRAFDAAVFHLSCSLR